jgi:hypothetical protein
MTGVQTIPREAMSNYALERSVKALSERAAGARTTGGDGPAPLTVAFTGVFYAARILERRNGVCTG